MFKHAHCKSQSTLLCSSKLMRPARPQPSRPHLQHEATGRSKKPRRRGRSSYRMQTAPVFVGYTPCCATVSCLPQLCSAPFGLPQERSLYFVASFCSREVLYPGRADWGLECSLRGPIVLCFSCCMLKVAVLRIIAFLPSTTTDRVNSIPHAGMIVTRYADGGDKYHRGSNLLTCHLRLLLGSVR